MSFYTFKIRNDINNIVNKYKKKEKKIKCDYIYKLEDKIYNNYKKSSKNGNFSFPELENIFHCLYDVLLYFQKLECLSGYFEWEINKGLNIIQNATQTYQETNTDIDNGPEPEINLRNPIYFEGNLCENHTYNDYRIKNSYKYGIRTVARVVNMIDNISLYIYSLGNNKAIFKENNLYNNYFGARYDYYLDYLLDESDEIIILPILQEVDVYQLTSIRASKVQIVGIVFDNIFADEDFQSINNFFWHDINHIRRMHQNNKKYNFIKNSIIDVDTNKTVSYDVSYYDLMRDYYDMLMSKTVLGNKEYKYYKLANLLLFEIIHEDAKPFTLKDIVEDLLFKSGNLYPYEKTLPDDNKIYSRINYKYYQQGASTLRTFYNKIRHKFFEHDFADDDLIPIAHRNCDSLAIMVYDLLLDLYKLLERDIYFNNELLRKYKSSMYYYTLTLEQVKEYINIDKIKELINDEKYAHHDDIKLPNVI